MNVLTTSAVGGEVSSSPARRPVAIRLLRRCIAAAILITLTVFSFFVAACLISVFAHGEKFIGEIDDILIALVFFAAAAAFKLIESRLRATENTSTCIASAGPAPDQNLTADNCEG
jgi:hypothetical protein